MAASSDTALSAKYIEWISLVKYLSILYALPVDKRKEDVTKIEEKAGLLEKELTRLSSAFENQEKKQRIKWQDIHQNLKDLGRRPSSLQNFNIITVKDLPTASIISL